MGLFGGNGFQGPGEEFGNSWDSFRTGIGRHMTGPDGAKSNAQGIWSSTGTTNPFVSRISGPGGSMMRPMARPGTVMPGVEQAAPGRRGLRGLFGGGDTARLPGILGLIQLLLARDEGKA